MVANGTRNVLGFLAGLALLAGPLREPAHAQTQAAASIPGASESHAELPAPPVRITGVLLGHDGRPMRRARAELRRRPADPGRTADTVFAATDVAANGSFRLEARARGLLMLELSGVYHEPALVPIPVDGPESLRVEVRLQTTRLQTDLSGAKVVSDWNGFSPNRAVPMVRQADGTYTAHLKAVRDSIAYEVIGVEVSGRGVTGTEAVDFAPDRGGGWRAIVPAADSAVAIAFDPRQLVRSEAPLRVRLDPAHADLAKLGETYRRLAGIQDEFKRRYYIRQGLNQAHAYGLGDTLKLSAALIALHPEKEDTDKADLERQGEGDEPGLSASERELILLTRLELESFGTSEPDTSVIRAVARRVSPLSPWWSLDPDMFCLEAFTKRPGVWDESYLQAAAQHPDPAVRAASLLCSLVRADKAGNAAEAHRFYERLRKEYPATSAVRYAVKILRPDGEIHPGGSLPDYSFASLDHPGQRYTRSDFQGRFLLIDPWATWCLPCLTEQAGVTRAYQEFHSRGLEVLSLSFDESPEAVWSFWRRAAKKGLAMTWSNGFVDGGFDGASALAFEITGLPRPLLVDRTGKIVAMDADLRGARLEPTLKALFGAK